jgi:hypothetical protein
MTSNTLGTRNVPTCIMQRTAFVCHSLYATHTATNPITSLTARPSVTFRTRRRPHIAQVVRRRPLTAETRVRSQACSCEICCEQSRIETRFFSHVSIILPMLHTHSFIHSFISDAIYIYTRGDQTTAREPHAAV